jgi:hypothetical protein
MKIFYIFLTALIVSFSGCSGASEENADKPTITLEGDRDITLKIGTVIKEPGYSATDPQDGDLTDKVTVDSNINFYKEGQYYVNYSVKDSDGNSAFASRIVTISNTATNSGTYSGGYQYGEADTNYYDMADYGFIYQVYEEGKSVTQRAFEYDSYGTLSNEYKLNFERNKNDHSIYKYINNEIVKRSFVGFDYITSVDQNRNTSRYPRQLRVNENFTYENRECHIVEHLSPFQTSSVIDAQDANRDFHYFNVIHTECDSGLDIYFASGFGEVLRVDNGVYTLYDKNWW